MENNFFNVGRFLLKASLLLSSLAIFEFLIYYIFYGFLYESSALLVTVSYLVSFIEGLFPILTATLIFFSSKRGLKRKTLIALLLSTTKILYTFPRYYLYFVSGIFNSIEAVMLSAIVSVLFVLFAFLQTFICISILNHTILCKTDTEAKLEPSKIFSLDCSANFGIVLETVFIFVIFLAKECFNAISYFSEVGGGYTGEEILMMVISFLLLPAFAFTYYLICAPIKNKILSFENSPAPESIEEDDNLENAD